MKCISSGELRGIMPHMSLSEAANFVNGQTLYVDGGIPAVI